MPLTTKTSTFALLVMATSTSSFRCSSVPPGVAEYKTSDYNCGGSRWSAWSTYNYISNSWMPALDFNWWPSTTSPQSHGVRSSDWVQLWCVSVWENDQEWYTVFKALFTAQNAARNRYDAGSHLRQPKTTKPRVCTEVWVHQRSAAKFVFCWSQYTWGDLKTVFSSWKRELSVYGRKHRQMAFE